MRLSVVKLCLILFCLSPGILCGQDAKSVTAQVESVFKELRPADRKMLADGYVVAMTSSFLSPGEKEQIDSVFQGLQALKVPVSNELRYFVSCVNAFCVRQEKNNLIVWLEGMKKALTATDRKRSIVKNYLETTKNIASDQALFKGASHEWLVRGKLIWEAGNPIRIDFQDADLVCTTRKDSIFVRRTTGYSLLGTDQLTGRGGIVNWNNLQDTINAELSGLHIDLKASGYTADSVWFHYDSKYDRPLLGQLKDNALKYERVKEVPYPEFTSYATDISIPDMYPSISYRGGIAYAGIKFTGVGTEEHPAMLQIAPNDTINVKIYSKQFLFDSLRILSGRSALVIAMDSGEITHPDINFLYSIPKHTVNVKRISEQSLHLPFKDTYHRILFDMEEIIWPIDSNFMEMRMSSRSGLVKATIESLNFFSDNVYDNIQGMDEINPLNGLLKCSLEQKSNIFTIGDYAGFMKKPAGELRKQIVLLSYSDFVDYNESRDEVTLKQRLFDYTKARVGKQDYDNIRFASLPGGNRINATLDVRNFTMKILGVEKFVISEARNIFVEPSDKQVVILKNRDMAFNGKLNAGMFDMYGQNLFFSYDQYKVSLPRVDSTMMYQAGRDKKVRGEKVKSLIRDVCGEILIDQPGNKSGKKDDPGFPVLNSTKESYIYFDDLSIQNGGYKRDSFYYVIKPYKIKGINDAERFRYAFSGTLVSNIVSPINDTLRLMKDNTLGMTYQTPVAGLELYGKGRINSRLTLNRDGFFANGAISLNKSDFRSDTILMLPGRMTAKTREIKVNAVKDQRPEAKGKEVLIKYLSKTGDLQATSTVTPFDIYGDQIKHSGTLFVYEDLMDASGKLELKDALLKSGLFNLQADRILSKNTDLHISSISNKDIQLNTSNVSAEIDMIANAGKFVNNASSNRAEFNSSRYACTFESFTWYMKENYLNIGIEDKDQLMKIWQLEDVKLIPKQGKNIFVSTDKQTDSLNFISPFARYDLTNGNIDCHWVNHIDVANGRFYPDQGDIFITVGGDIREFTAGRLLCERTDSVRLLTDVRLNLKGRNTFSGSGNFTYVSEEKKNTVIRFTEVGTDTSELIFAKAQLKEEEALLLNSGLSFKGSILLHSKQPDLFFAGYVGLITDKIYLKHTWLAVNDYLDSKHIRVPVNTENRDDKKQRIFNGVFLHTDKAYRPYGAFMSSRTFYNDDLLAGGKGNLEWLASIGQYVVADTLTDKYCRFAYDPETSIVSSFSKLNLDMKLPGMSQRVAGDISYDLKEEVLKIRDVFYALDFTVLPKMEGVILKDFGDKKLKTINVTGALTGKIYEIFGKEGMAAVNRQLTHTTGNVPDSLNQFMLLDSLNFNWNAQTHSYVANGQVNILAIKGKPVEKVMNIKMELLRARSGNQFFMYIYNDQMWYYFEYSDQSLYTLSSNTEYNEIIKAEKADKKVVMTKEKETLYTITLCPESKKDRFVKRIK